MIQDLGYYPFGSKQFSDLVHYVRSGDFVRALLGKIEHSKLYSYDYVFFDCPPNFTALSYSVLASSNFVLIPINTNQKPQTQTPFPIVSALGNSALRRRASSICSVESLEASSLFPSRSAIVS